MVPGAVFCFPQPIPAWPGPFLSVFLAGFILLLIGFKVSSERSGSEGDIPSSKSRWILAALLAAGAFLRLAHMGEPPPMYWFDYAVSMTDARAILDLGWHPIAFPFGDRPPLYEYLLAGVWRFLPDWPAFQVQNLAWALMDLSGVWLMYLLGKEAGGRRTGILLAAWAVFCKPLLVICLDQQQGVLTAPMSAALLLFTLRFIRRTDRRHALQWGAALAFSTTIYQAIRPTWGLLPVAVGTWALFSGGAGTRSGRIRILGAVGLIAWTYWFLRVNLFLPGFLAGPGAWTPAGLLVLLAGLYAWAKGSAGDNDARVLRWFEGMLAAGLLMAPLVLRMDFAGHAAGVSIFHRDGVFHLDSGSLGQVWPHLRNTLWTLWAGGQDQPYACLPGESFLDFYSLLPAVLGLAFLAAKPNRTTALALLCLIAGLAPHVLSGDPHSAKLMGAVAPTCLLGALALDRLFRNLEGNGYGRSVLWAGLILYGLLAGSTMVQRFYVRLPAMASTDTTIYRRAKVDVARGRKVLVHLSRGFFPKGDDYLDSLGVLSDRLGVGLIRNHPLTVWAPPGSAPPDLALYLQASEREAISRARVEFPAAQWEQDSVYHLLAPMDDPMFYRVYVSGGRIPEASSPGGSGRWIVWAPAPPGAWRRRVFTGRMGLDRGMVDYEDESMEPLTPIPATVDLRSAAFEGNLPVRVTGTYRFSVETGNYVLLKVGGDRVLDLRPDLGPQKASVKKVLEKGEVPVQLVTYYRMGLETPQVWVRAPDGTEKLLGPVGP